MKMIGRIIAVGITTMSGRFRQYASGAPSATERSSFSYEVSDCRLSGFGRDRLKASIVMSDALRHRSVASARQASSNRDGPPTAHRGADAGRQATWSRREGVRQDRCGARRRLKVSRDFAQCRASHGLPVGLARRIAHVSLYGIRASCARADIGAKLCRMEGEIGIMSPGGLSPTPSSTATR